MMSRTPASLTLRLFAAPIVPIIAFVVAVDVCRAEPEEPTANDRAIARQVALYLEHIHLRGQRLDDEVSRRIFTSYLDALDPLKLHFLASDIEEFSSDREDLDDKLRKGELDFPYRVFHRYLERVAERAEEIRVLIDADHDFDVEEYVVADPDELEWAKDTDEARDRWRRRIKLELLGMTADGVSLEDARERLHKRYRNIDRRRRQMSKDDLLQVWLTAATTVYDPHTSYMSPSTLENFEISMKLQLVGIGAVLTSTDGETTVTSVLPGGAAAKEGRLKARDKIEAVAQGKDGEFVDVFDWRIDDVVHLIRGDEGTVVRLRILHPDTQKREDITIERAKVELKDAEARGEVLEQGKKEDGSPYRIGVIDLPSFYMDMQAAQLGAADYKSTSRDVAAILAGFREKKVDAVVMDLRQNSGGALTEAIRLTGLFIDRGPVVQIRDSAGDVEDERDEDPGMAWDGPLVVLTSKSSASASEIFAGAIQDYRRGIIVGDESTHGKGTVQRLLDMGDRRRPDAINLGALKITVSKFYRPSGKSTQSRGVAPDIVLPSLESYLVDGEADLDYAIEFDEIAPAPFRRSAIVTKAIVEKLEERSRERREGNDDFKKLQSEIAHFVAIKDRKRIPLRREKFLADYRSIQEATAQLDPAPPGTAVQRSDEATDEGEAEAKDHEKTSEPAEEPPVVRRDFYIDEILAITVDFVRAVG